MFVIKSQKSKLSTVVRCLYKKKDVTKTAKRKIGEVRVLKII